MKTTKAIGAELTFHLRPAAESIEVWMRVEIGCHSAVPQPQPLLPQLPRRRQVRCMLTSHNWEPKIDVFERQRDTTHGHLRNLRGIITGGVLDKFLPF
jgi:hypothetical protein